MSRPSLSIVIPVHDNADTLEAQLDGVAAGLADAATTEIVVVDNRSSDGSAATAEAWAERSGVDVRVEPAPDKASEPYARNVGLGAARADAIAYCDGDDVVSPTWVAAMTAGLAEHPYVTGPIDTDALNEPWLANVRGQSLFDGRPLLYDTVPFAHGCNIGIRRDVLERLGGFDETYAVGCDVELAIRAWRAGIELAFCPDALVHYRLRPSLRATYRQGRAYGQVRRRFRQLLDDGVDPADERRARLRRLGWLVKNAPRVGDPSIRARWVWVASQLDGEARGFVAGTLGGWGRAG